MTGYSRHRSNDSDQAWSRSSVDDSPPSRPPSSMTGRPSTPPSRAPFQPKRLMKYTPKVAISEICPERDFVMMLQVMHTARMARNTSSRRLVGAAPNQLSANGRYMLMTQARLFGS